MIRFGLILLLIGATACMAVFAGQPALRSAFVISCFAAGGIVFCLWRVGGFTTRFVLTVAILLRIIVGWLPPTLSDDAFRYVWDGSIQIHGFNPYSFVPTDPALSAVADTDLLARLNSPHFYSVYPPVSQIIFYLGAWVGDGEWLSTYYVIKILFMACELAGLLLLSDLTGPRGLLLFAWNPLVIMETAGQAHTESAVILFLVATLWLAKREKGRWASVALSLAGWVKLYPFVLFPFLWRRFGWSALWPGLVAAVAVATPYLSSTALAHIAESLDLYVRYFEFNAGPYYALKEVGRLWTGQDISKTLGPALRMVFLMILPAIYVLDARLRWPLRTAFAWAMGAFFLLTTTIHPWYILGLLAVVATAPRSSWHWLWLGLISMGTYLLYVDGPYWPFVIVGWTGWFVLAVLYRHDEVLQIIVRFRAGRKYARIRPYLPPLSERSAVLDLGAGEGYVGAHVREKTGADVTLADVLPLNRTDLPYIVYDGRTLPFKDDTFDVVTLYFVLHHSEDQIEVLREALRVSRGPVLVIESVYLSRSGLRWLTAVDKLANRWRSNGSMKGQEEHLHFRTDSEWRELFRAQKISAADARMYGSCLHRQALYVLHK